MSLFQLVYKVQIKPALNLLTSLLETESKIFKNFVQLMFIFLSLLDYVKDL